MPLQSNQAGKRPGGRIPYGVRIPRVVRQGLNGLLAAGFQQRFGQRVLQLGIAVHLWNGRAWNDVVELVAQDRFPAFVQLRFRISLPVSFREQRLQAEQPFGVPGQQLQFAVHLFVVRLAGVGSSMVFQVQLTVPGMNIAIRRPNGLLQLGEKFVRPAGRYPRKARHFVEPPPQLQMLAIDTAASIPITVRKQKLFVNLFVAIRLPNALHAGRLNIPVIGIPPETAVLRRSDEVRQHLAAVDTAPVKRIMWHAVVLVPADFRCHKRIDARLAQYLRQGPAVSEHVREP
ncbi:hypothetical protein D3C81_913020 [compost metagenome]